MKDKFDQWLRESELLNEYYTHMHEKSYEKWKQEKLVEWVNFKDEQLLERSTHATDLCQDYPYIPGFLLGSNSYESKVRQTLLALDSGDLAWVGNRLFRDPSKKQSNPSKLASISILAITWFFVISNLFSTINQFSDLPVRIFWYVFLPFGLLYSASWISGQGQASGEDIVFSRRFHHSQRVVGKGEVEKPIDARAWWRA